jgi:hypothetical protein
LLRENRNFSKSRRRKKKTLFIQVNYNQISFRKFQKLFLPNLRQTNKNTHIHIQKYKFLDFLESALMNQIIPYNYIFMAEWKLILRNRK